MKKSAILLLLALAVSTDSYAQKAGIYHYVADLESKALKQGTVVASSIRWNCSGSRCTVSGPWPTPGESACRALAEQVGPIRSYGHKNARLSSAQLARCNGSAAAPPAEKKILTPGPIRGDERPETVEIPDEPTAILSTPVDSMMVYTPNRTWRCRDRRRCNLRHGGPDFSARHAVKACGDLAHTTGRRVIYFGDRGYVLNSEQLAQCNSPAVRELEIIACSGEDDLRRNSTMELGIQLNGVNFHAGHYRKLFTEIPSNACKTARLPMGGFLLSELRIVHVRFRGGETNVFDAADNWDMAGLTINAIVTDLDGRRYMERVLDLRDNPIRRFKTRGRWSTGIRSD